MQLFHTFVVACVIFASSVIANPAVASQSESNSPAPVFCRNKEKLTHKVDEFCDPAVSESLGFKPSVECHDNGGRGYYCVDEKQNGICVDLDRANVPYFGGECFRPFYD